MNIKDYYKKDAKQVINITLSDTQNNAPSSSVVLTAENNDTSWCSLCEEKTNTKC